MSFFIFALVGFFCFAMKLPALGLPTAEVAIVGRFGQGPEDLAINVNAAEFNLHFRSNNPQNYPAEVQALQFFRNGGANLWIIRVDPREPLAAALKGSLAPPQLRGLGALLPLSNLGLLVCPELTSLTVPEIESCLDQIKILGEERPLFTLLDPPPTVSTAAGILTWRNDHLLNSLAHTALYFPTLNVDPESWSGGTSLERLTVGASGTVAAMIQKNDVSRGLWKAPAGPTATIISEGLTLDLNNTELADLTQSGINTIRDLPTYGKVVWGSRTLDTLSDNLYLSVSRTRRWVTRSLERELSDAALLPNDQILWSNLQQRVESFLDTLFRQGAFAGISPNDAYFAKCNHETTTPRDIAAHEVNIVFGASYLRSAEFSVDKITLKTLNESQPTPIIPLLTSRPVEGVTYLRFPTLPGYNHRFQSSGNLQTGSWSSGSEITGDGSWITLTSPISTPKFFFRIETTEGW